MQGLKRNGSLQRCGIWVWTVLLLTGCAASPNPPGADGDQALAARVKAELIVALKEDSAALAVEAAAGTVRLKGFTETKEQKRRAEDIARAVEGVERVVNDIRVKAMP